MTDVPDKAHEKQFINSLSEQMREVATMLPSKHIGILPASDRYEIHELIMTADNLELADTHLTAEEGGGFSIALHVSPVSVKIKQIEEIQLSQELVSGVPVEGYEIISLQVGRVNIMEMFKGDYRIYLVPATRFQQNIFDSGSSEIAIISHNIDPETKTIMLPSLSSATDIAALLHELGHTFDPDLTGEYSEKTKRLKEIAEELGEGVKTSDEAFEIWKYIIEKEVAADRLIVEALIANKSEALSDLVPDIEEFKNFLRAYLGSYLLMGEGMFYDRLTEAEIVEMVKF